MGKEYPHRKVKLIIPVLYSSKTLLAPIEKVLTKKYGTVDYKSKEIYFTFTNYYNKEMGTPIYRYFLSFRKLIRPEELVKIKLFTNHLELKYVVEGKRKVNLDPGYMELGKFILATTKDQQHRIYIEKGIYEEITLFYTNKSWHHWDWTYPDYRSNEYKSILREIREIYKRQID